MHKVRRVVLFCDVSGFMRLSTSLGDRMPGFVQEFYETIGEAVVGGGGRLVKYIGDAVLCVFPAGGEVDAVRCAGRMRGEFARLVERHVPGGDAQLGVAISSGEVTEGVYGHGSLRLFDIMGEAVAHAAVLNRLPGIKVTGPVRDSLGSSFPATEVPAVALKWAQERLRAWTVSEE